MGVNPSLSPIVQWVSLRLKGQVRRIEKNPTFLCPYDPDNAFLAFGGGPDPLGN